MLTVSVALLLGAVGLSKFDQTNKISWSNQEKIALAENNAEMCSLETAGKNTALFVSCAGFLE